MRIRLPQWIHQDELLLLVDWSDLSTRVSDHYQSSYDNNKTDTDKNEDDEEEEEDVDEDKDKDKNQAFMKNGDRRFVRKRRLRKVVRRQWELSGVIFVIHFERIMLVSILAIVQQSYKTVIL